MIILINNDDSNNNNDREKYTLVVNKQKAGRGSVVGPRGVGSVFTLGNSRTTGRGKALWPTMGN